MRGDAGENQTILKRDKYLNAAEQNRIEPIHRPYHSCRKINTLFERKKQH